MDFTDDFARAGTSDLDTAELDPQSDTRATAGTTAATLNPPGTSAFHNTGATMDRPASGAASALTGRGAKGESPHPTTQTIAGIHASQRTPPQVTATSPGSQDVILRGRYVLEEKIGEGGTSVVYRARDLRRDAAAPGGQRVALKLLRPGLRNQPRAVERLKREFHHAQMLSHPAIARVYDVDCDSGAWFLTLELLEGEPLSAVIERSDPALSGRRVLEVLRACGEALAFAHERGVVHGDFKPGNVFITSTGQVRVLDFGSASASWLAGEAGTTATPAYASPEVLSGQRSERRDDVFSFACAAYELLTQRHPFDRRSSLEARNAGRLPDRDWNLSARQWHALESGLAWTRDERPASIRALLGDLTANEIPSPLVIPEIREKNPPFRAPGLAPFSAVAALAALGAVVFVANWQLDDAPHDVMGRTQQVVRDLANLPPGAGLEAGPSAAAPATAMPSSSPPSGAAERSSATQKRLATSGGHGQQPAAERSSNAPAASSNRPANSTDATPSSSEPAARSRAAAEEGSSPALAGSAAGYEAWRAVFGDEGEPLGASNYVSFDVDSIVVSEGASSAVLRINRRLQLDGRAVVQWRTLAGSARPGEDFREMARGTAEFADGQTTRAIYVPLLNDLDYEGDESFAVELFSPSSATRINPIARVTVTVRDNDGANEYRLAEQKAGSTHTQ